MSGLELRTYCTHSRGCSNYCNCRIRQNVELHLYAGWFAIMWWKGFLRQGLVDTWSTWFTTEGAAGNCCTKAMSHSRLFCVRLNINTLHQHGHILGYILNNTHSTFHSFFLFFFFSPDLPLRYLVKETFIQGVCAVNIGQRFPGQKSFCPRFMCIVTRVSANEYGIIANKISKGLQVQLLKGWTKRGQTVTAAECEKDVHCMWMLPSCGQKAIHASYNFWAFFFFFFSNLRFKGEYCNYCIT